MYVLCIVQYIYAVVMQYKIEVNQYILYTVYMWTMYTVCIIYSVYNSNNAMSNTTYISTKYRYSTLYCLYKY